MCNDRSRITENSRARSCCTSRVRWVGIVEWRFESVGTAAENMVGGFVEALLIALLFEALCT